GPEKVRGDATYAYEQLVHGPAYLYPLQAAIAAGEITGVDAGAASAEPGVLAVLTHENAPRLVWTDDAELAILQSGEGAARGQFVGGVVAETPEIAGHAGGLVRFDYAERAHDVELRPDTAVTYAPQTVMGGYPADTAMGDADAALASAAVTLDATYTTAM